MRSDERRWILLRAFYQSYRSFHALMDAYERRVAGFAESYGMDRADLELTPEELLSLFDSHALLALREGDLSALKQAAHELFRRADVPEPFDGYVTNIYHEVSLLKEEHWTVREGADRMDHAEYKRYYGEVNVYYPRRLEHVRTLYEDARRRLEKKLLPAVARNRVIVRSVYLFGGRLIHGVYAGGLEELYGYMYPNGGALTGYTLAADSFIESGFAAEAVEAYGRAIAVLEERLEAARDGETDGDGVDDRELKRLSGQRENLERSRERALALG